MARVQGAHPMLVYPSSVEPVVRDAASPHVIPDVVPGPIHQGLIFTIPP